MVSKVDLRRRYEGYTDESLIEIITKKKSDYADTAIEVATQLLVTRGVDVEEVMESYQQEIQGAADDIGFDTFHNIENLSQDLQDITEGVSVSYKEKYQELTDPELLSCYTKIIEQVDEKGTFGELNAEDSLANFIIINTAIKDRGIKIPEQWEESRRKVIKEASRLKYKEENQKKWIKILVGTALVLFVVTALLASVFRLIFILLIFIGIKLIRDGIRQPRYLKELF